MTAIQKNRNSQPGKSQQRAKAIVTISNQLAKRPKIAPVEKLNWLLKSATQPTGEAAEIRNGGIVTTSQAANNQEEKCSASWGGFERRTIAVQQTFFVILVRRNVKNWHGPPPTPPRGAAKCQKPSQNICLV